MGSFEVQPQGSLQGPEKMLHQVRENLGSEGEGMNRLTPFFSACPFIVFLFI